MTTPEPRPPRPSTVGLWWVVAAASLALLVAEASIMTGLVSEGVRGRMLSRLDLAGSAVIAVAAALAVLALAGRTAVGWGTWLGGLARRVYPMWWLAVIGAMAVARPGASPRQLISYALVFRSPGDSGPPAALSVGWILAVAVPAVALAPLWWRWATALPGRLATSAVGAIVVAAAFRWGCQLLDVDSLHGPLSWLPAHLDTLVIAGSLAALVVRPDLHRWGTWAAANHHLAWSGAALVGGAWLLDVITGPNGPLVEHVFQAEVHHWAGVAAGAGAVALALAVGRSRMRHSGVVRWPATPALGLLLWWGPALVLIARQYRERYVITMDGRFLDGPALPPILWAALVALGIAFATLVAVQLPAAGWRQRAAWLPTPFALGAAAVTGGAFAWRVVALFTIAPERTDGGDPLFYHTTANLLAQGRGFLEPLNWIAYGRTIPSALHGPLYPVYLSFFARLGGTTYVDNKLASCLVGAAVVLVAILIARRLAGPWTGLVAGVLAAVYPNLWVIDGVLFPEGLFVLLCGLAILAAYRWRDHHRWAAAVALGAFIGLATLTRGEGLFLVVLLAAPWMLLDRSLALGRRLAHLVAAGAACLAVLAPWMVHNLRNFEVFVPLSTNGNELLVYANCDETYNGKFLGFWLFDCQEQIRAEEGEPPGDEAEKSVYWRKVGVDYARDHLDELPKVIAARVLRQWELFRPGQNIDFAAIEGRDTDSVRIGLFMYYGLAALAIAGAIRCWRRKVPIWPLMAQVVSVTVTAAYAYGTTRFRAPAELTLCVLAAVSLTPLLGKVGRRLAPRPLPQPSGDPGAFVAGAPGWWHPRRWHWAGVASLGTVLAVVALPLRGMYRSPGAPMEEGFMLTFPERVLAGDVPNVDFLHLYGPGSLHALAGAYRVFGVHLEVERTVGLVQHLGIVLAIYALARSWGRLAAAGCAILAAVMVLSPIGLSALAWNGAVALGLWSLVLALRASAPEVSHPGRWWVASGVLAGLALTYRPDVVVALALGLGAVVWTRRTMLWRRFAPGFAVGLIPMFVHLAMAGVGPSVEGMLLDPVFRLRPGRELPRPPSWDHLDGALQVIAEKFPPYWPFPAPRASEQLFVWFFLLPAVAFGVLAAAIIVRRRDRSARTLTLLGAAMFGVGLLPQALQRPDSAHFLWVSCVSFAIAPLAVIELVARARPAWPRTSRVLTGLGTVTAVLLVVLPFYTLRTYLLGVRQTLGQLPPGLLVERAGRRFYLGDVPPWLASTELVRDLDAMAQPGERLLVGPVDLRHTNYSDVVFYYLFPELEPATQFIEMDPGMANAEGSSLADDVASADWLILTRFWSGWIEPNDSRVFGPDDPNRVVEEQFCLVRSYQHDLARLYRRCEGGGAPGPYDGPYEPAYDPAVEVNVDIPPRP